MVNDMNTTTNITIRIDKNLKESSDLLFKELGTNTNCAINMFLRQCVRQQSLIFTPAITNNPSKELLESLREMEDYENGKVKLDTYKDTKSMRKALLKDE